MKDYDRLEMEAEAFRNLVSHLKQRVDVQNIDLMNLAGFCRNCLSKWYKAAGEDRGLEISLDDARQIIYGMPYNIWKEQHQKPATEIQQKLFEETKKLHAKIPDKM